MFLANIPFRTAQIYGDSPAFADETREFCWRESLERIRRLAGALSTRASGSRVAILAQNSIEYVEMSFAAAIAGVPFVPMNTRLAPAEYRQLLATAAPSIIMTDRDFAPLVRELLPDLPSVREVVTWGMDGEVIPYEDFITAKAIDPVPCADADDWAIIFTGGTTGLPKGVRVTRGGMAFNVQHILRDLDWGSQPRFLQLTPMFHLAALGPGLAVAAWGGRQFVARRFELESMLEIMHRERIHSVALVPTMIAWLVGHERLDRYDLSALRGIGYGASAIHLPVLRKALDLFPGLHFNQFYGQTEASGGLSTLVASDHQPDAPTSHRLRSAGRPLIGARVGIFDSEGNSLPNGATGEVCAQTPGLFAGYLGNDEATRAALRDGWLRTGDVGHMDDDGYLYITDRIKDMIVTGGENVSSSEVESAIAAHPAVAQVAVVAAPDPLWGERIHAFIELREGAFASEAEIAGHCRELIAAYKCPKSMTIGTEPLPLSSVGKIKKDVLRARLLDQDAIAAA
ncbi:MAG: AMP-binding protein [Sphingomonadales bacterium]|jgi:long-chain acyl-CoA synthetase|nr:AMP-binding protein [Sphingomonadales bacterium]MBK9004557.1 AMP-binding protein [Sphingomonadales bacterium]MBK9269745.1 AMP-binding protein [Sphingomonadales bacterium]MBP6434352.1 AMP-binding protein [Sphingorhabdus sp.]